MDSTGVGWKMIIFIGLVALLRAHLSSAAAESASPLDCKVTRLPDGSFRYQLSHSSDCPTWWEDKNKTVIARNSDQKLDQVVRSLSSQSIILKVCHEYLRYTRDCLEGLENAECKENCSSLLDQDHHPPSVNSTLTCLFGRWCPDPLTFGLGGGVVVGVPLLAAGVWALISKYRRRQQRRRSSAEPVFYSHVPQVKRPEPEGVKAV